MTLEQQIDALAAEAERLDGSRGFPDKACDLFERCWRAERKLREAERALEWVDPLSNGTAWDKHTALRAEVEAILKGES